MPALVPTPQLLASVLALSRSVEPDVGVSGLETVM